MSAANISLNASVRDNLYNLQKTENAIQQTNKKLNSGKKINNVEDDPVRFYRTKALRERSAKFTELQEGIDSAVSLIKSSNEGISTIEDMMKGIKANLENMLQASSKQEFNAYRSAIFKTSQQIMQLGKDSSYNGTSYINNTLQEKEVALSNIKQRKLHIQGLDMRAAKLGLIEWNMGTTIHRPMTHHTYGEKYGPHNSVSKYFVYTKVAGQNIAKSDIDAMEHQPGKVSLYHFLEATINGDLSSNYEGNDTVDIVSMFGHIRHMSSVFPISAPNGKPYLRKAVIPAFKYKVWVGARLSYFYGGRHRTVHTAVLGLPAAPATNPKSAFRSFYPKYWQARQASYLRTIHIDDQTRKISYHSLIAGQYHNLLGRVALANFTQMIGDQDETQIQRAYYMRKNINAAIEDANYGLSTLKIGGVKMATNMSILNNRKDFNSTYTKELDTAADDINLIDTSREVANYRASSARNKMGIAALNVASQHESNLAQLVQ